MRHLMRMRIPSIYISVQWHSDRLTCLSTSSVICGWCMCNWRGQWKKGILLLWGKQGLKFTILQLSILVWHFWRRWQLEYLTSLRKYSKWRNPVRNLEVGDIVVLREDNTMPTQWPIARIVETHQGRDRLVRVVKLHTKNGIYVRPVAKVALLLPCEWSTYRKL